MNKDLINYMNQLDLLIQKRDAKRGKADTIFLPLEALKRIKRDWKRQRK